MGRCPCANPPGKGTRRPHPRRPKTLDQVVVRRPETVDVTPAIAPKALHRLSWIHNHMTTLPKVKSTVPKIINHMGGFITGMQAPRRKNRNI